MVLSLMNTRGLSSSVHFAHIGVLLKILPFAVHTENQLSHVV
jgi:hypothetical protein